MSCSTAWSRLRLAVRGVSDGGLPGGCIQPCRGRVMTSAFDEEGLRHWLADYLVTNVGCSPYDIDFDASMSDLGLGSRDAVGLSGGLSELLGRKVSPVEFWEHPSIADLAQFLSGSESTAEQLHESDHRSSMEEPIAIIGLGCRFPG